MELRVGLDIGSTTIKCVVIDENNEIIYSSYERHLSKISEKIAEVLKNLKKDVLNGIENVKISLSGSAGMGIAENCGFPFVQEVYATRIAAKLFNPETDAIIELGGEDAKILFLNNGVEVRMNGSCAGGTGAFIDQMASLLNVSIAEMNELAKSHEKIYTIASRCGVFAKTDIQPLLNQGGRKSDISASIFYAVVNQTIAGLAQGREISGNVLYLGGPLTFISELRAAFDDVLKTKGTCPKNSLYYVSLGAALASDKLINLDTLLEKVSNYSHLGNFAFRPPLFNNEEEYLAFKKRHDQAQVAIYPFEKLQGPAYLGIDAGSTTLKCVVMDENKDIYYTKYMSNSGNPVPLVKDLLQEIYKLKPDIQIKASAVTGYGEDIIKNAFKVDFGIVETIAHFMAAKKFMPEVEFVIDIGGQDIKCFKIHNGTIDNIFLNEACSSGCGSFLQTFASALGYDIASFSKLGLFAKRPVNLGSRCTVFMNSAVKQAQKDGASIEDISAGLSLSVVKNALYKVIRASSPEELGKKVVVQGGTFLNDAVLRAFELEMGIEVVRPNISGLMGAYGAALYAQLMCENNKESTLISAEELEQFTHKIQVTNCGLCENHCRLTINVFNDGRRFIGGNRCERPITKKVVDNELNIYSYKLNLLQSYRDDTKGKRGEIGIPLGLNMFELLPFWTVLFNSLDIKVIYSPLSSRKLYLYGQTTIPSDTVCFPAKLMHGHIRELIKMGVKKIFYPCMSYNIDEKKGDNHYNCPVVAYYSEVINNNIKDLKKENIDFIKPYLGIHRHKDFASKFYENMKPHFPDLELKEVQEAVKKAYEAYDDYLSKIRIKGDEIILRAREKGKQILVLAGRPYHLDPEINHGIDKMLSSFDVAIISEDVVSNKVKSKINVHVLNQWTYHSRLYYAASYIRDQKDMNLIQLVSFGCGVDAITTDEVRDILEKANKIYTQIKIDEITNLGAVKIRIRSLLSALERKENLNGKIKIR